MVLLNTILSSKSCHTMRKLNLDVLQYTEENTADMEDIHSLTHSPRGVGKLTLHCGSPRTLGLLVMCPKKKTPVWIPTPETTTDSVRDGYLLGVGEGGKVPPTEGTLFWVRQESMSVWYQGKVQWTGREFQRPDAKSVVAKTEYLMGERLLLL